MARVFFKECCPPDGGHSGGVYVEIAFDAAMSLVLDHVAVGMGDAQPALLELTERLGGTVVGGGTPDRAGFRVVQVHLGEPSDVGMTIELLEPFEAWHNDFLERFVATRGDGPHHLTFKTDDIRAEHERLVGLGIKPIGLRFDTPSWREMFLHPKDAHGIVVQIAQSPSHHLPMPKRLAVARTSDLTFDGKHNWWGQRAGSRAGRSVVLRRVVLRSQDVERTAAFWCDVMGASRHEQDLVWDGGALSVVEGGSDGVARFEVEGLDTPVEIGGTHFSPISSRPSEA